MSDTTERTLATLAGTSLGEHTATYDDTAAILYALSVGASATDLDLVYERDLQVLPTYACALGLWAVEAAGRLGAYDPTRSLHASQLLQMHQPMPREGSITMSGSVAAVHDKGKASIVEIAVTSEVFTARYDIFLPGMGGWGGERGPSRPAAEPVTLDQSGEFATSADLAALYRLTGDRHPVHIDPATASANGFARPILHGLCTLGIAARMVALQHGKHPASLAELEVRLASPVLPGDVVAVRSGAGEVGAASEVSFEAAVGDTTVLSGGRARFA